MLHILNRAAILDGAGNYARQKFIEGHTLAWHDPKFCEYQAKTMITAQLMSFQLVREQIPMMEAMGAREDKIKEVLGAADNLRDNEQEAIEFAYQVFCLVGPVAVKEN